MKRTLSKSFGIAVFLFVSTINFFAQGAAEVPPTWISQEAAIHGDHLFAVGKARGPFR